jgi:hypothetical protein
MKKRDVHNIKMNNKMNKNKQDATRVAQTSNDRTMNE